MLERCLECVARRRPDSFVALTRSIIIMMMIIVMMMVVASFVYLFKRRPLDVKVKRPKRCKI